MSIFKDILHVYTFFHAVLITCLWCWYSWSWA